MSGINSGEFISIKVTAPGSTELTDLLLRQTRSHNGIWNGCKFYINQPVEKCDWWVVCHGSALLETESTICDPDHIVYISMEPSEQWVPSAFHKQFSTLVLCDRKIRHQNVIYANGLTWWVGINVKHENRQHYISDSCRLDYDSLKEMSVPLKKNRISVVCSKNNTIPGHKKRLEFIDKLHAHPISDHIDFFGGGHAPIADKWDAIAPYRYHLALENSTVPDYWSEKLADALLGFAMPIYYGCPNIHEYFDQQVLQVIDIDDFDKSVVVMELLLEQGSYDQRIAAINQAREQVLDQYNIFQLMSGVCTIRAEKLQRCTLRSVFELNNTLPKKAVRFIRRLAGNH